jgi:AcrR family transcriptional regulator
VKTGLASASPRERVLETASELFYAHGVRAVGVDTIIARAEVAKASFYKHFPSKDDLVVAFLRRRDGLWRAWLEEAVARLSPAPAGRPLAVFDALAERFARADYRGCAFINSIVELADRDHPAHRAAEEHKRQVVAYLGGLLQEAGVAHPGALPRHLMLLMDGATVTAVREGSPRAAASARSIAKALLQDVLPAVHPRPRRIRA